MKYIDMIVAALMGIISLSLAAPTLAKDIIQGLEGNYTISDIQWEVPINPDRTDTVTGTIEDVVRHLEVVAPELLEADDVSVPGLEPTRVSAPKGGAVVRTPSPTKVTCSVFTTTARKDKIREGISYLRKVHGKPTNKPKSCGQVSCSYNSAIMWCNENTDYYTLDSYGMIADGAEAVIGTCAVDAFGRMNGKAEYEGNWGVAVLGASC